MSEATMWQNIRTMQNSLETKQSLTPDATATPRTIAQAAQDCLTNLECNNYGFAEACAIIASAMREVVERELTAAKAEIARLKHNRTLEDGENAETIEQLESESAQLRAELSEANHMLTGIRAMYDGAHSSRLDAIKEAAQLRARVAELETVIGNARSLAYGAPELNMCNYDHEQVRQLNDAMCDVFTILDAARAGKGAT